MKNVVLFEKPNQIQAYKMRYAIYLTLVPLFSTGILLIQLLIFSMLNLYYLEGNGLIIDPQVREAYYDQVIQEVLPVTGYVVLVIIAVFCISLIVMNWAVSPFTLAEKTIRAFDGKAMPARPTAAWASENLILDRAVVAFLKELATGEPQKEFQRKIPIYQFNPGFLIRFGVVYAILSLLTGYVLGLLLNGAFMKVVSLALNVVQGQFIRGHYFTAQEEVLSLGVTISIFASVCVYLLIGYHVTRYMSTMVAVFHRAFREKRYPIQLRKTDIYHSLADAVNEKAALRGKN